MSSKHTVLAAVARSVQRRTQTHTLLRISRTRTRTEKHNAAASLPLLSASRTFHTTVARLFESKHAPKDDSPPRSNHIDGAASNQSLFSASLLPPAYPLPLPFPFLSFAPSLTIWVELCGRLIRIRLWSGQNVRQRHGGAPPRNGIPSIGSSVRCCSCSCSGGGR